MPPALVSLSHYCSPSCCCRTKFHEHIGQQTLAEKHIAAQEREVREKQAKFLNDPASADTSGMSEKEIRKQDKKERKREKKEAKKAKKKEKKAAKKAKKRSREETGRTSSDAGEKRQRSGGYSSDDRDG